MHNKINTKWLSLCWLSCLPASQFATNPSLRLIDHIGIFTLFGNIHKGRPIFWAHLLRCWQSTYLSVLEFCNSPFWNIQFDKLDFLSTSNLNFTGRKIQFKLGKKSSSSNSVFQTRELQKSSADRKGSTPELRKQNFLEFFLLHQWIHL